MIWMPYSALVPLSSHLQLWKIWPEVKIPIMTKEIEDSATDTAGNDMPLANDSFKEVGKMKKKATTAEKVMTSVVEAFLQSQREVEKHLLKYMYEERREKEERTHVLS